MDVSKRVHIIPLGYEKERVLEPIRAHPVDTVILLEYGGSEHSEPDYHTSVRNELSNLATLEREECDIFDLYACLGEINTHIAHHRQAGNDVYVNLATGSKVTAIAGMIACMATGGTPYYVHADSYSKDGDDPPEEPVSFGADSGRELSGYPIESPSYQDIAVLQFVAESDSPVTKERLIEFGVTAGLPFITEAESASADPPSTQARYRRLNTHVLNELKEDGYVEVSEVGQKKMVEITDSGRNTLQAFRHLADNSE